MINVFLFYKEKENVYLWVWARFLLHVSCMQMMLTPHSWARVIICPILFKRASRWATMGSSVGRTMVFWMRPTLTLRADRTSSGRASKLNPFSSTFKESAKSCAAWGRSKALVCIHKYINETKNWVILIELHLRRNINSFSYGNSRPYRMRNTSFRSSSGRFLFRHSSRLSNCFAISCVPDISVDESYS